MINVKKWLAALMTAAMIIGGIGLAGIAVYAADDDTVPEPKYVAGWTIDRPEYGTIQYGSLSEAYNNSRDGDVIYPSQHNVEENDEGLVIGRFGSAVKKITINVSSIKKYTGEIRLSRSVQGYCLAVNNGVYTVDEHIVKNVVFNWDFRNARAMVTEICDNCGTKEVGYVDAIVEGAADCTKDQTIKYTASYTTQKPAKTWTEEKIREEKATGHTYAYAPGTLRWVMDETTGLVKRDPSGNPIATAKINCAKGDIADADRITVTPAIKTVTETQEATCLAYGKAEYTFVIPQSELPQDATNNADIEIKSGTNFITLANETEKIDHVAGEPTGFQYLKVDPDTKEETWVDNVNNADDDNGTIVVRLVSYCIHRNESGHPRGIRVYGEKMTVEPLENPTVTHAATAQQARTWCTRTVYSYAPMTIKYYESETQLLTKDMTPASKTVTVTDHVRNADKTWTITEEADCGTAGSINFTCKECGQQIQNNHTDPKVLPNGEHKYEQLNGADRIYHIDPTCTAKGYDYKICTVCQQKHVVADAAKTGEEYGSYVVKEIDPTGHKYYAINPKDAYWFIGTTRLTTESSRIDPEAAVSCYLECACSNESVSTPVFLTLHSAEAPQGVTDTDTEKWNAISVDVATKDCTEYDKITYTLKDVVDIEKRQISLTVGSVNIGAHKNDFLLNWSEDGKDASLTIQCQDPNCKLIDPATGLAPIQTEKCDVAAEFNADGSIKYTATCKDYDLKDNTKDVFDLREATVTTNTVVDTADIAAFSTYTNDDLAKKIGLSVTVNGVELDKDIYTVACSAVQDGKAFVTVSPKNPKTKDGVPVVGSKDSDKFTVKEFAEFRDSDFEVKVDGLTDSNIDYKTDFTYDGTDHTVELVIKNAELAKGATVKYAAVRAGRTPKEEDFTLDSFTQQDVIYCDVWAMVTKDEYRPYEKRIVEDFEIYTLDVYVYIDNCTIKQGQTPEPNYFIGDSNHRPIGVAEDILGIRIATAAGKPLTGLEPGQYVMTALSDNRSINVNTRGGLNYEDAPILTIEKDATAADKMAADKVAGMIDALNESSTPEQILAASDAYNALTPAQQKLVDAAKVAKLDKAVADSVTAMINALNESSTPEQVKAAWDAYNALSSSQKTLISKEVVTKVTQMAEAAGLVQKDSSITIKNKAKAKVKRGKAIKVNYTKVGDGKVTIKISGNKKVKRFFKVKGNKIKVAKKAKKGKYKVKVTVSIAATQNYKAAKKSKTIKVTVK